MADQSTLSDTEKAQADAAFAEALRKVSLSENAGGNGDAASVTSTSATAASSEYEDDVDEVKMFPSLALQGLKAND
jgi:hypothetical protein